MTRRRNFHSATVAMPLPQSSRPIQWPISRVSPCRKLRMFPATWPSKRIVLTVTVSSPMILCQWAMNASSSLGGNLAI